MECSDESLPNYTVKDDENMAIFDYTGKQDSPGRVMLAKLPTGQLCELKKDIMRPETFPSAEVRTCHQCDAKASHSALRVKKKMRTGRLTVAKRFANELTKEDIKVLGNELRLLRLYREIKASLCKDAPHVNVCLTLLDEMAEVDINALILKKHPNVVESILHLLGFGVKLNGKPIRGMEGEMKEKAALVRKKAFFLFQKFKALFGVTKNKMFLEVFRKSVEAFEEKVAGMDVDVVIIMTQEPSNKYLASPAVKESVGIEGEEDPPTQSMEVELVPAGSTGPSHSG